jgi:hypothetical protein
MKDSSKFHFAHTINIRELSHFAKLRFLKTSAKLHQNALKNSLTSLKIRFILDLCMDHSTHISTPTINTSFWIICVSLFQRFLYKTRNNNFLGKSFYWDTTKSLKIWKAVMKLIIV